MHIVNQYFPNDQDMMLQNHAWVKESFKVQTRQILMKQSRKVY